MDSDNEFEQSDGQDDEQHNGPNGQDDPEEEYDEMGDVGVHMHPVGQGQAGGGVGAGGEPGAEQKDPEPIIDINDMPEVYPETVKDRLDTYREEIKEYGPENWSDFANGIRGMDVHDNMSNNELIGVYAMMWTLFTQPPGTDIQERVKFVFPNVEETAARWRQLALKFTAIERQLAVRGFLDLEKPSGRDLHGQLSQISFCIRNFYNSSVCANNLKYSNDDGYRQMLNQLNPLNTFRLPKDAEMTNHQKAAEVILERASNMRLRREGRRLFEPAYYSGQFTYSYRPLLKPHGDGEQMEILDFINTLLSTGLYQDLRHNLTVSGGNVSTVCKQLEELEDPRLPVLERHYDFFSFRNGVYCIANCTFYTYVRDEGVPCISDIPSHDLIACKFHDMEYPYREIMREAGAAAMDDGYPLNYMKIDFEPIRKILSYQKFDEMEMSWILAFCGRLLYKTGRFDTWGMWPYFLGIAGTGKSTLVRLIATLLDRSSVGILGNNAQREFGFEGLLNKRLVLALDLDNKFTGDQMTIQSMIVGEEVSINRKGKVVVEKQWDTPAAFCANLLPNWSDNNGAMSRRLFVVEFLEVVNQVDTTLMEECKRYLPRFLTVIVNAYHHLRAKVGRRDPKSMCPAKFKESEERAVLVLNPMLGFIKEECVLDASAMEDKSVFLKAYIKFCQRRGLQKTTSEIAIGPSLSKKQIKLVIPVGRDHNGMEKPYYTGVKLRNVSNDDGGD